jgi:hypothetical protein
MTDNTSGETAKSTEEFLHADWLAIAFCKMD